MIPWTKGLNIRHSPTKTQSWKVLTLIFAYMMCAYVCVCVLQHNHYSYHYWYDYYYYHYYYQYYHLQHHRRVHCIELPRQRRLKLKSQQHTAIILPVHDGADEHYAWYWRVSWPIDVPSNACVCILFVSVLTFCSFLYLYIYTYI